jgi:hypothetical protein
MQLQAPRNIQGYPYLTLYNTSSAAPAQVHKHTLWPPRGLRAKTKLTLQVVQQLRQVAHRGCSQPKSRTSCPDALLQAILRAD